MCDAQLEQPEPLPTLDADTQAMLDESGERLMSEFRSIRNDERELKRQGINPKQHAGIQSRKAMFKARVSAWLALCEQAYGRDDI